MLNRALRAGVTCVSLVPLMLALAASSTLTGCGQSQESAHSDRRSIPTEYVQGSFVVATDVTTSDSQLAKSAKDAGDALGCSLKKPERINWGAQDSDSGAALSA